MIKFEKKTLQKKGRGKNSQNNYDTDLRNNKLIPKETISNVWAKDCHQIMLIFFAIFFWILQTTQSFKIDQKIATF